MVPITRSSVNTPEASSRNATENSSDATATMVIAVSSRSAGRRWCRGYRVMNAEPTPSMESCTPSMIAEMAPAVRPTSRAGNRLAANSQNRKPKPISAPLPEMRPRELQIIGCERAGRAHRRSNLRALATLGDDPRGVAAGAAFQGLPERPEHPRVVVEAVGGVIGNPPRPPAGEAQGHAPYRGGQGEGEQPTAPPAMLAHHPPQPMAVGEELPAGEGERVVGKPVDDDGPARYAHPGPGALQAPAQLDVLAGEKALVEAMPQQRVAVEDGGHQPEPILAAAGPVVLGQRLAPVPGAGRAAQAGLEGEVAALAELVDQRLQRALRQHHVGVDQGDQGRRGRLGPEQPGHREAPPFIGEQPLRVAPGDLAGAVGGPAVDDDELPRPGAGDR